jgi:large subunit ribosomal protein L25
MSIDKSTLEVKSREGAGKGAARKLRATGLVPAVVYGKHLEKPLSIAVNAKAVRQALNTPHKLNTLLTLKGEGTADGGLLTQVRRELAVYAKPRAIPEKIEADVTHLKIATALHINEVKMPEGVVVKTNVNYTIAVVSAPEGAVEAAPAAAAAAPAAAAAAKPAAGAAAKPAAGAAAKPAAGAKK